MVYFLSVSLSVACRTVAKKKMMHTEDEMREKGIVMMMMIIVAVKTEFSSSLLSKLVRAPVNANAILVVPLSKMF